MLFVMASVVVPVPEVTPCDFLLLPVVQHKYRRNLVFFSDSVFVSEKGALVRRTFAVQYQGFSFFFCGRGGSKAKSPLWLKLQYIYHRGYRFRSLFVPVIVCVYVCMSLFNCSMLRIPWDSLCSSPPSPYDINLPYTIH